jgi:hypothetical protein
MEQPSGGIPERHGTGLVRWSARLVLFLLAAGVRLLLGDGHATAAPFQYRSVAVSLDTRGERLPASLASWAPARRWQPAGCLPVLTA